MGVRWDEFLLEDLLELVGCFEPAALGMVMLVMAQEYQSRGGGVPDLVLWKVHESQSDGDDDNVKAEDGSDDGNNESRPSAQNPPSTTEREGIPSREKSSLPKSNPKTTG